MQRLFYLKSPAATKEISISKQNGTYFVDIVAYGNLEQGQFDNLKDCFNFVREYFNLERN